MKIVLDDELRPLIEQVVTETLERLETHRAKVNGRLGYPEAEAAAQIGVPQHVLRDCRLRGEIEANKVGKKWVYERTEILRFLRRRT